jgi:AcrR family transcriptional regulator
MGFKRPTNGQVPAGLAKRSGLMLEKRLGAGLRAAGQGERPSMGSNRGFDVVSSKSRDALVAAAAELLTNEGYHVISARRVAEQAGLKPQLVHYYFRSMDDLIVAAFHFTNDEYLEHHDRAMTSPTPLRALWKLNSSGIEPRRILAFMALASNREPLRLAMLETGERHRQLQIETVAQVLKARGFAKADFPPAGLVMMMAALSRTINTEAAIGLTRAHDDLRAMIERFLDIVEPLDAA